MSGSCRAMAWVRASIARDRSTSGTMKQTPQSTATNTTAMSPVSWRPKRMSGSQTSPLMSPMTLNTRIWSTLKSLALPARTSLRAT